MDNTCTLSSLREGQRARVTRLDIEGSMRRRLMDMGLTPGTSVICLHRSPAGDPIAYFIRGAVIALRKEDTSRILIEAR
ncbi:MAG: ferrous iron transport protein A [Ruminococcus sp.]|nr:ferrous iron transport protein A [Ruminococcus sp.]